jgi:hypothetical protein
VHDVDQVKVLALHPSSMVALDWSNSCAITASRLVICFCGSGRAIFGEPKMISFRVSLRGRGNG